MIESMPQSKNRHWRSFSLSRRAFVAFAAALAMSRVAWLKKLAHRARWIVAQLPPTDAELEFLATGKLPGQDDETKQ